MTKKTFRSLYNFIQVVKRNKFGYHIIFEGSDEIEDIAFHIYDNKRQVNVCVKDENEIWCSIMNFIFDLDDNIVKAYIVEGGVVDYENYRQYSMDDELGEIKGYEIDLDSIVLDSNGYVQLPNVDDIVFQEVKNVIILALGKMYKK